MVKRPTFATDDRPLTWGEITKLAAIALTLIAGTAWAVRIEGVAQQTAKDVADIKIIIEKIAPRSVQVGNVARTP